MTTAVLSRRSNRTRSLLLLPLMAVVLLVTAAPGPARATAETDGTWIVYTKDPASTPESGDEELYATKVNGSRTVRLTFNSCTDMTAHASRDGRWLAWVQKCGKSVDLVMAPIRYPSGDLELGSVTNVSRIFDGGSERWPQFSPDGTQVAFMRMTRGNFDIWRADFVVSNGEPQLRAPVRVVGLGASSVEDCCVSWSPNGSSLVFASNVNKEQQGFDLYRVSSNAVDISDAQRNVDNSADGTLDVTQVEQLTSMKAYEGTPAYDADGSILFRCNCPNADVYRLNPYTLQRTKVTTYRGMDRTPEGFPDGIVYSRMNAKPNYEIYVAARNGTNPINITRHPAPDLDPTWVPAPLWARRR